MSSRAIETIIHRILNEPEFRESFRQKRTEILKGLPDDLKLSPAEEAAISAIDVDSLLSAALRNEALKAARVGSIYL